MNGIVLLTHLSFAMLLFLLLPLGRLSAPARFGVLAAAFGLAFVPCGGIPLALYMRSLFDDLATTTLLLLGWGCAAKLLRRQADSEGQSLPLALCFGTLALLLYPAALGLSAFDPYRLGYAPGLLLAVVFAIAAVFWWQRQYLGAAVLTLATAAFASGLKPSNNYWDYLVDPLLGFFCCGVLAHRAGVGLWRRLRSRISVPVPAGPPLPAPWPLAGIPARASHPHMARFTIADLDRSIETMEAVRNQSMWEIGSQARRLSAHHARSHCHRFNQKSGNSDRYRSSR